MTLDSSNSHPAADETKRFHSVETGEFPKGKHVSEPGRATGSEVEECTCSNDIPWCYLFVHHRKVKAFEAQLVRDRRRYFIHTSIRYAPRRGKEHGVRRIEVPTVSGLIFMRGNADEVQAYLDCRFPLHHLCRNCSTGEAAEIPDSQMQPFMRVVKSDPDRVRFLLQPFVYYAKNRTLLRIVSGDFAGLEGYVVRMARDRKLVMNVGGMSIAIGGIHAERFEEVDKNSATKHDRATFYKRNLHERNAFIDHYFHKVTTRQEVAAQAENIDMLRQQTIADMDNGRLSPKEAYDTFHFVIEEIGYYYAPFIDLLHDDLKPIFNAGAKVMHSLSSIIPAVSACADSRERCEAELEELRASYGYLLE